MHRFFIPSPHIKDNLMEITDDRVVYQLFKVLRAKPGMHIGIFDKEKNEWEVEITSMEKKKITGRCVEKVKRNTAPKIKVDLYQAIPKKPALFELIVQKATEIGAARIFPLITERTENRRPPKSNRMNMIAIESAEQCSGLEIPEIKEPITFAEAIKSAENAYLAYECEKGNLLKESLSDMQKKKMISLFIGPEGGFSQKEIDLARLKNVKTFSLGSRILRTETAAIVSLGLILAGR